MNGRIVSPTWMTFIFFRSTKSHNLKELKKNVLDKKFEEFQLIL